MKGPRVLSLGLGVDSTALLFELVSRGETPDLVLTADPGAEKPATYDAMQRMIRWMRAREIRYEIVRYTVRQFRASPPYSTLLEASLINGCLPSIAFGRHSCSLRFKVEPQDRFLKTWQPAVDAWAAGLKVTKIIGLDAGPRDSARYAHAAGERDDPLFDFDYPLRDWGWDRETCERRIAAEGEPVPVKSSCTFCTGMKPPELEALPPSWLRLIVLLEARAAPRLRTIEGMWRRSTRSRPGRMTDYIAARNLLPIAQIEDIQTTSLASLIEFLDTAARLPLEARTPLHAWLSAFEASYAKTTTRKAA